jgi:predicted short-subunit dehydrogenase-like oxidoreductase (DUF2520 family)
MEGGVPAAGSDSAPDAFAMMMRSSQKKGSLEGRSKRGRDGKVATKIRAAGKLHAVEDARREMMGMGFDAAAIDRALKLRAHGTLVDLAVAVAACISADGTCSQKSSI